MSEIKVNRLKEVKGIRCRKSTNKKGIKIIGVKENGVIRGRNFVRHSQWVWLGFNLPF